MRKAAARKNLVKMNCLSGPIEKVVSIMGFKKLLLKATVITASRQMNFESSKNCCPHLRTFFGDLFFMLI